MYRSASSFCAIEKLLNRAVGIEYRAMNSFANVLLPSSLAAALLGPKILRPLLSNLSTIP